MQCHLLTVGFPASRSKSSLHPQQVPRHSITSGKGKEADTYFTAHGRIKSKWIQVLNVKLETKKVLEENIGNLLYDPRVGTIFLSPHSEAIKDNKCIEKNLL